MVQFSPKVCMKLFKCNLRNVTVLNTDTQNVQCQAQYIYWIIHIDSHYVLSNWQNILLCICIKYSNIIQQNVATENALLLRKTFKDLPAQRAQ